MNGRICFDLRRWLAAGLLVSLVSLLLGLMLPAAALAQTVTRVEVRLRTGPDDLRSDTPIQLRVFDSANRQLGSYDHSGGFSSQKSATLLVPIVETDVADIARLEIVAQTGGGIDGDNWDLLGASVSASGPDGEYDLGSLPRKVRFTGENRGQPLGIALALQRAGGDAVTVRTITVSYATGEDDLRRDTRYLVKLRTRSGTVNLGRLYGLPAKESFTAVYGRDTPIGLPRDAIEALVLTPDPAAKQGGGFLQDPDKWDLRALRIEFSLGDGRVVQACYRDGNPLHRFEIGNAWASRTFDISTCN